MKNFFYTENNFIVEMDINEFKQLISKKIDFPGFTVNFENGAYRITANTSVGILIINGYRGVSISTNVNFSGDEKQTTVNLKSSFRPEYLLIAIIFIVSSVTLAMQNVGVDLFWLLALFTIVFTWFRFIIQSQEEILHSKIKKFFGNTVNSL